LREGVAADDLLYVTGTIGDAALGLLYRVDAAQDAEWTKGVSQADAAYLAGRYLLPQPRLCLREALRAYAHAAMDISDGLAGDLAKILQLTGMTAEVMATAVPLSKVARKLMRHAPSLLETIFTGGDDYELLCAVPSSQGAAFEASANAAGVLVRPIGTAKPGTAPPVFKDMKGRNLVFAQPSFRHF
jgi:thiamine-monophosphate kinase